MATKLSMSPLANGTLKCHCGASTANGSFYICDIDGQPLADGMLICCDRCGRIMDAASGKFICQRSFSLADWIDLESLT